jgi:hypothetical protein
MSFKAAWHSWRIKVHDILEVGGETVCVVPGRPIKLLEGDFEMALLERRRHKHNVVADTPCRVYVLDSEGLARLSRRHPEIVQHMKSVAKERARENERATRGGAVRNARPGSAARKKQAKRKLSKIPSVQ